MNLRHLSSRPRPVAALLAAAALLASAPRAEACGGCFIPALVSSPIVQEAERVLFIRDAATDTSTVWVEIRYNGPAADFGWVLPLPKAPDKVGVGTSYFFDRLELATAPRFRVNQGPSENCNSVGAAGACSDIALSSADAESGLIRGGGGGGEDGKITVLQHDQVGPYDYKVIQSSSASDIQKWLSDNGFATPQAAIPVLEDHVANGFVFLAVKLASGKSAKEIKPIALKLPPMEPCVPLRLTSIAAVEDALVQVHVAGPGRAIPKNHLHVRLNPVRFNWYDLGSNYAQVLAAAMDEAAGRAFVTEFAGSPPRNVTRFGQFGSTTTEDLVPPEALFAPKFPKSMNSCAFLSTLRSSAFPLNAETAGLVEGTLGLAAEAGAANVLEYYQTGGCDINRDVDGEAVTAALEEEFCAPVREANTLYKAQSKVTRMAMRISPSEMTKDPVFAFNSSLPDVSRDWVGVSNIVCAKDGFAPVQYRLTLDGLGSWRFGLPEAGKGVQQPQFGQELPITSADPRFADAPAALSIELLDETGPVKPIAPAQIELVDSAIAAAREGKQQLPDGFVVQAAPQRYTPPISDPIVADRTAADACNGGRKPASVAGLLLAQAGLVLWLRRRRNSAA